MVIIMSELKLASLKHHYQAPLLRMGLEHMVWLNSYARSAAQLPWRSHQAGRWLPW